MRFEKKIAGPFCGTQSSNFVFKREWTSANLFVNEVKCPTCDETFRIYFGKKSNGEDIAYTIPKRIIE
jgi:hypothetical protein